MKAKKLTVVLFDSEYCQILKRNGQYIRVDKILHSEMEIETYIVNHSKILFREN